MGKVGGLISLMRPANCAMMGFAVIVGSALADYTKLGDLWRNIALGFATGFALTAASMAANDYHDRQIDAVNEPNRPVPSGTVKPEEALILASVLTVIGFIAALLTNFLCLLSAAIAWMIFMAYTVLGKRSGLLGNFLVSLCVAVPFIHGNLVVTDAINTIRLNVLMFASMAFLSNTGREVTKGIVDFQGDRAQNIKTLAVRYGERTAAMVAASFYVSAVLVSPFPWIMNLVSPWFLPFVAVTDVGLAASSVRLLRDHSRENARRIKQEVLLWFLFGLFAFVVGAFL